VQSIRLELVVALGQLLEGIADDASHGAADDEALGMAEAPMADLRGVAQARELAGHSRPGVVASEDLHEGCRDDDQGSDVLVDFPPMADLQVLLAHLVVGPHERVVEVGGDMVQLLVYIHTYIHTFIHCLQSGTYIHTYIHTYILLYKTSS
jgi:hypothetical protein